MLILISFNAYCCIDDAAEKVLKSKREAQRKLSQLAALNIAANLLASVSFLKENPL